MPDDPKRAAIIHDSASGDVAVIQLDQDGAAFCDGCDELTEYPVKVDGLLVCEVCA